MRFLKLIALIAMSLALFACGDHVIFGPPGTSTIIATGGDGTTGAGGNGASIDIYSYGDVKIQSTGMVDTYFAVPSLNSNFGTVPVEISSNTTVAFVNFSTTVNTTSNLPESGTLFVAVPSGAVPPAPDRNLYQSTGPGTLPNVVTGLKVNPGVTLAIPGNGWNYGPTLNNSLNIWLDNAIEINGTVVNTADNEGLYINSGNLLKIGPSGKVTTVSQTAGGTSANIYLYSSGSAINQGIIDGSGPAGGGNAGWVEFEADNILYNTGSLLSVGGDNAEGAGGMGNFADLYSYTGSIYSSGIINVSGGKGSTAGGGVVDGIEIYASEDDDIGRLFVTGSLLANGGEGLAGAGGSAGYIDILNIYSHGALRSNAKISAKGGKGADGFDGGSGGALFIGTALARQGYDYWNGQEMPSEPIQIYGNIDVSGSNGGVNGGSAGRILIVNASNFARQNLKAISGVELYGFVSIKTTGGNGATTGGNGGRIDIGTASAFYIDSGGDIVAATPAGGILNEAAITTKGGNGVAGDGGNGGTLDFYENGVFWAGTSTAINRGSIDMTGGDGNNGGNGGDFWVDVHDDITNTGPVTSKGGKGVLAGGQGGAVELDNTLNITNSASIIVTGGAGATGGDAPKSVSLIAGEKLVNSGAIVCNGGAGDTADVGGAGGNIELFGGYGTTNSGSLNVTGGTGKIGTIVIDGSDVTPTSGIL